MPAREPIIDVRDLTREFTVRRKGRGPLRTRSTVAAVERMTFSVQPGESVGYIGANGAGKSTTIKMLTGILVPTSGSVRTCGLDPVRRRRDLARRIGVVFGQRSQLWWDLPLRESFSILAAIHRLDAGAAAAPHRRAGRPAGDGPRRSTPRSASCRSASGCAPRSPPSLLHSPELLILDEPTIGLDVLSKQRLREFLRHERSSRGTTLLLTTHDMGDVERLCDRVLVVDRGMLGVRRDAARAGARRSARAGSWWSTWSRPQPDLARHPRRRAPLQRGRRAAPAAGLRRPHHDRGDAARGGVRPRRGARPVDRGARHRGRRQPDLPVTALNPAGAHPRLRCRPPRSGRPPRAEPPGLPMAWWVGVRGCAASACCPGCWA